MPEPIKPLADAVERLSKKTPIGSVLKSADWQQVPLMLRERAQFSAGVTSARVLQAIQDRLSGQVQQLRENVGEGKTAIYDRSSFIDSIREIARDEGLTPQEPEKRGGLQDITSIPRLGMVYDMQNAMASGYATWKLDQNEGALALWPAYRFGPSTARVPRTTWLARWAEAGASVGWKGALQKEMVALKTSPIWAALSRFGTPWPPFDYGSTRELEDVEREEAIELGLIGPDDVPSGGEESFNRNLQASVEGLDPKMQGYLEKYFGDRVEIADGVARWSGESAEPGTSNVEPGTGAETPSATPQTPERPAGASPMDWVEEEGFMALERWSNALWSMGRGGGLLGVNKREWDWLASLTAEQRQALQQRVNAALRRKLAEERK